MLAQIRAFAKSPFATVLLALLVVSFAIWGIRDVFHTAGVRDAVIQAGNRPPVTSALFKDRFNYYKQQLEQQQHAPQPISLQDAIKHDLDKRIADELAFTESTAAMITREGIRPSDELIGQELRKTPAFFNPITGAFDKAAYEQRLAQMGLTPVQADAELRDEISEREFITGMAAGLRPPLGYGAMEAVYVREGRSFEWFAVDPKTIGPPVKPTDAQLNAFIHDNAAQLTKPEMRQLSVVHISAAAMAPTTVVTDAAIQKRFDFEKDTLSQPEKRTLIQISVKTPAEAAAVSAKLKAGGDPATVAQSVGAQALPYVDQPKSAIADPKVADAAFSLKAGEVSGPLQGSLGLAVIKVIKVTPGHAASLAEAKPKLEQETKLEAARAKAYDLVQKYDDAHSGGADMAASAKTVGQTVVNLPPVFSQGSDVTGKPSGLPTKVLQSAFNLPQGGESDMIDLGQGEYYVVHVDKVLPPALPKLDEIRAKLEPYYVLRDTVKRLQAKADTLADAVRKGEPVAKAAASVGATPGDALGVMRNGNQTFSTDLVNRVFAAKTGEVVVGQDKKLAFIVAKVTKITPDTGPTTVTAALAARMQVARSLFDDIGQAARVAARARIKPTVDYRRARSALGVNDNATAP